MIDQAFNRYSADKTGLADFGLESAGMYWAAAAEYQQFAYAKTKTQISCAYVKSMDLWNIFKFITYYWKVIDWKSYKSVFA